uniref:hypothetical protein n=1 Tax=Ningiella ruwaisensis TaxID=2364274 RepID=UPI00109F6CDD|nr:hypothetical protein [Ningiella ruwaisensis]
MLRTLKIILLTLLGLAIIIVVLGFDLAPAVQASSGEQVEKADSVNRLLSQVRKVSTDRQSEHSVVVTLEQAQSLAGFFQRAHKPASADLHFKEDEAILKLTYLLASWPLDIYANIEVSLASAQRVHLNYIKLGDISIPGNLGLYLSEIVANAYTNSDVATRAIDWVQAIEIEAQQVTLLLNPAETLFQSLKTIDTGQISAQERELLNQISYYINFLSRLPGDEQRATPNPSLAYFLNEIMKEALRRDTLRPEVENEAALLALAVYTGNYRFARLIGDINIPITNMPTAPKAPTLAGRKDLSLHFVYSAAIKLLSEQGFSIAVGEFKELMDRGEGGSGYSFTDLAADLAGAHFAKLAVDPEHAQNIQTLIAHSDDEFLFFPSLEQLDEGLDAQAFANKYQAVDSPAYQQAVDLINQRLQALPVSQ